MQRINFISHLFMTGIISSFVTASAWANVGDNYPCLKCHQNFSKAKILNLTLPLKKEHQSLSFKHMKNEKSCLLCHSDNSPNELNMLDGKKISMSESPQLCGQCHGPIYFDWQEGIHGKLFGKGTDQKRKFICAECHDPHNPKFKKMKAEAPPTRPKLGIAKVEHEEKPMNSTTTNEKTNEVKSEKKDHHETE